MNTLSKKSESIISLTQTEIMLVLVVIILLLLMLKEADLTSTKILLAESEEKVTALEEHTDRPATQLVALEQQVNLAEEVKDVLVSGGVSKPSSNGLEKQDITKLQDLTEEKQRLDKESSAIDNALKQGVTTDKRTGEKPLSREEKIQHLGRNAAIGNALIQKLGGEAEKLLDEAEASGEQTPPIEKIMKQLTDGLASEQNTQGGGLGDQVGFNPCWPRPASKGKRRYYYVYDVTYTNGFYRIARHQDWNESVPIINEALRGKLSVLRRYPRNAISPRKFSEFGKQIENALAPMRGTHGNDAYPEKCLLAITLNEGATGKVAKFLRHEVNLYPITR